MRRINDLLRPGGLLISVTPCLGDRTTLATRSLMALVRLAGATGLMPPVRRYTIAELEESFDAAGLVTIETDVLEPAFGEYFVAARKP
jgi:hypothetical protein